VVTYKTGDDSKKLRVTTSFVFNENKTEKIGVSIVVSDVTELHNLTKIRRDSSIVFAVIISVISLYLYIYRAVWESNPDVSPTMMTWVVEGLALLGMLILLRTTSLRLSVGFRLKKPWKQMRIFVYISVVCVLLLVLIKFAIQASGISFFPEGVPFWDWGQWESRKLSLIIYPFTVLIQEIIARCVMQESLYYIFSDKYKSLLSILASSLIFGVVHIAHGFYFMLVAFIMLCMLGTLYEKTRNLWGVALVHLVLGVCVVFLRFAV